MVTRWSKMSARHIRIALPPARSGHCFQDSVRCWVDNRVELLELDAGLA
jgi:hypothetical protein